MTAVLAPGPLFSDIADVGSDLTPVETKYLAEVAYHGSIKAAADCTGTTGATIKHRLTIVHAKTGAGSTIESLWRVGWLRFPEPHMPASSIPVALGRA